MKHRWGRAAVVALVTVTACSGGTDEADEPAETVTAEDGTAEAESTGEADGRGDDSADSNGDAADQSTEDESGDGDAIVDVAALQEVEHEVVDPDAEHRCERLGYTCSWSDLDPEHFDEVLELADEIQTIVATGATPEEGLDAAVDRLASEPVVELIVDREGMTGMLYRLDGTPELFATTELAAPVGDPVTLDLSELEAELDELAAGTAAPIGFAGAPRDYHPSGGPTLPKRGIVLDPYATEAIECPPQTPLDGCLADRTGRNEGAIIYGVMNAHPQVTVDYFAGSDVAPWNLENLGDYDLIHLASHGSSGCANRNEGWTTGVDDPAGFVDTLSGSFRNTPLDKNRCYSVSVLGPFDKAKYDAWGKRVPPGIGMNGSRWAAITDFWSGKVGSDSIVYLSNCTSADGRLYGSGSYGSFVGWHSYARTSTAYEAGMEFWRLMVVEGLEFDLAIEELKSDGLGWTVTATGEFPDYGASGAFLASHGKNQRARDVITAKIDGADLGGQVLRVAGLPDDGNDELFPADGQVVTFEVEGVRDGTAGSVVLEVWADGRQLDADVELERDGQEFDEEDEWSSWRVTVPAASIELPDTTAADYGPGASPIELEVRAYTKASEYTADIGPVTLGSRLVSNGPLPIFTELADGMPAGGKVTGNDLAIEFDTAGGDVTGSMRVQMLAGEVEVGYWELALTGTYDPATGTISGEATGESQGGVLFITAGDEGAGTWQGTVDLAAQRLTAVLGVGDASQPYEGVITPATTAATG